MFDETYNRVKYPASDTTVWYVRQQAINRNVGTYNVLETFPAYDENGIQYKQKGLKI